MRCSYSAEMAQISLKLIFDGDEKFSAVEVGCSFWRQTKDIS